jgi:hypothetical protein
METFVKPVFSPDGYVHLKLTIEEFQDIKFAVESINKKRSYYREKMAERRSQKKVGENPKRMKPILNIESPDINDLRPTSPKISKIEPISPITKKYFSLMED